MMKMTWKLLKEIVRELRVEQNRLIKKQDGRNEIMIAISIYHPELNDSVDFYPHAIDLRTGSTIGQTLDGFAMFNIKEILKMKH